MHWKKKIQYYIDAASVFLFKSLEVNQKTIKRLERKVRDYTLPDVLRCQDGSLVSDVNEWLARRRPEILSLFKKHVYGIFPESASDIKISWDLLTEDHDALGGITTRKEMVIYLIGDDTGPKLHLLMYLPNNKIDEKKPVPMFLGLNFNGNHTICDDPGITIPDSYLIRHNGNSSKKHKLDRDRGSRSRRWQIEYLIRQGFGLATAWYWELVPDRADGISQGIHRYFYRPKQERPERDEWGAIGAWAWGLSRALDCLLDDPLVDRDHVAVFGHSRLGKTALWAGANDERFWMVISNNSGCGGAALSRRRFGETVALINQSFPHWFCENFKMYDNNEDALPVDQHMLLSLVAPRLLYVASASRDLWADPVGEFLSTINATPVYNLFGLRGITTDKFPPLNQPINGGQVGYHVRRGGHGVYLFDWTQYVRFAKEKLGKKIPSS
ncbi:MAG: glucuronyl esterase domain-containing protein [Promethearchaeota archaeon]